MAIRLLKSVGLAALVLAIFIAVMALIALGFALIGWLATDGAWLVPLIATIGFVALVFSACYLFVVEAEQKNKSLWRHFLDGNVRHGPDYTEESSDIGEQ